MLFEIASQFRRYNSLAEALAQGCNHGYIKNFSPQAKRSAWRVRGDFVEIRHGAKSQWERVSQEQIYRPFESGVMSRQIYSSFPFIGLGLKEAFDEISVNEILTQNGVDFEM